MKFYDFIPQARNLEDTDLPRRHYLLRRIPPQLSTATYEEQQFAESPALPKAFAKAVIEVRDETPLLVDDMLSDSGLFGALSKALPAILYEFLRQSDRAASDGGKSEKS